MSNSTVKQLEQRIGILEQLILKTRDSIYVISSRSKHFVINVDEFGDFYKEIFGNPIPFMTESKSDIEEDLKTVNNSMALTNAYSIEYETISLKEYYQIILSRNKNFLIKLQGDGEKEI